EEAYGVHSGVGLDGCLVRRFWIGFDGSTVRPADFQPEAIDGLHRSAGADGYVKGIDPVFLRYSKALRRANRGQHLIGSDTGEKETQGQSDSRRPERDQEDISWDDLLGAETFGLTASEDNWREVVRYLATFKNSDRVWMIGICPARRGESAASAV